MILKSWDVEGQNSHQLDGVNIAEEFKWMGRQINYLSSQLDEYLDKRPGVQQNIDRNELRQQNLSRFSALTFAKYLYSARRRRLNFVDGDYLGEPGWDLFLDLFIAFEENRLISISSATLAAAAAPTTGLRWVTAFEKSGLIVRTRHLSDKRVSFVAMRPDVARSMRNYLSEELKRLSKYY